MEKSQLTTNTLPTSENDHPSTQPPGDKKSKSATIYDLPVELLLIIFQEIIGSEALQIRQSFPLQLPKLGMTYNLALVNKQWGNIVNESSSLWRVFWFNVSQVMDPVQREFDHLLALAKGSPIDLLLMAIHNHKSRALHFGNNCVCGSSFFTSLQRIANLRSLSLEIVTNGEELPLTLDVLPSLANLQYFHLDSYGAGNGLIDIYSFLSLMPQLLELRLRCPLNQRNPSPSQREKILLPRLRWLDFGPYTHIPLQEFASLLRHCPNIDYLCFSSTRVIWELGDTRFEPITLYSLQTLHIKNSENLSRAYFAKWISTPNLVEFVAN